MITFAIPVIPELGSVCPMAVFAVPIVVACWVEKEDKNDFSEFISMGSPKLVPVPLLSKMIIVAAAC